VAATVGRHNRAVEPAVEPDARIAGRAPKKSLGFDSGHGRQVVDVLATLTAVADPVVSRHRLPRNGARARNVEHVEGQMRLGHGRASARHKSVIRRAGDYSRNPWRSHFGPFAGPAGGGQAVADSLEDG